MKQLRGLWVIPSLGCRGDEAGRALARLRAVVLSVVAVAACGGGDDVTVPWKSQAPGSHARRVAVTEWDTLWSVGGSLEDTVLLFPGHIEVSDSLLAVLDFVTSRVIAFDPEGNLQWTFGDPGEGPRELESARDLVWTGSQRLAVLDPVNAKIVELDRRGRPSRSVPLADVGFHPDQIVPVDSMGYLVLTSAPDSSIFWLDRDGSVRRRWPWPWRGLEKLHLMTRQGFATAEGDRWAFALTRGNGWFTFEDTASHTEGRSFVEHAPFPDVVVEAVGNRRIARIPAAQSFCTACAVSLHDGLLYVLYGGRGSLALRVVDVYDWSMGAYKRSYRLPYRASGIAVYEDRFYVVSSNPYPLLQALRPRSSSSNR